MKHFTTAKAVFLISRLKKQRFACKIDKKIFPHQILERNFLNLATIVLHYTPIVSIYSKRLNIQHFGLKKFFLNLQASEAAYPCNGLCVTLGKFGLNRGSNYFVFWTKNSVQRWLMLFLLLCRFASVCRWVQVSSGDINVDLFTAWGLKVCFSGLSSFQVGLFLLSHCWFVVIQEFYLLRSVHLQKLFNFVADFSHRLNLYVRFIHVKGTCY